MRTVVVSDIHFGSPYCRVRPFIKFLDSLPPDVELVLNGDVVDKWNDQLEGEHLSALNRLTEESKHRRVVWVRGNHDERFPIPRTGNIHIEQDSYHLMNILYILHGDHFDFVMPNNRLFMKCFRAWHHWRIKMGAPSMHVSSYAKQYPRLYKFLTTRVKRRAVRYARAHNYESITCGHTHFKEDTMLNGIRYLNTGSWTEDPPMCIRIDGTQIDLVEAATAFAQGTSPAPYPSTSLRPGGATTNTRYVPGS